MKMAWRNCRASTKSVSEKAAAWSSRLFGNFAIAGGARRHGKRLAPTKIDDGEGRFDLQIIAIANRQFAGNPSGPAVFGQLLFIRSAVDEIAVDQQFRRAQRFCPGEARSPAEELGRKAMAPEKIHVGGQGDRFRRDRFRRRQPIRAMCQCRRVTLIGARSRVRPSRRRNCTNSAIPSSNCAEEPFRHNRIPVTSPGENGPQRRMKFVVGPMTVICSRVESHPSS